ncbi:MAG: hypothetical protein K0V04_22025 [Deltaproteobacteria bacterium]|nr:hypothetical protein [Deltaproteobacteria bacterium]
MSSSVMLLVLGCETAKDVEQMRAAARGERPETEAKPKAEPMPTRPVTPEAVAKAKAEVSKIEAALESGEDPSYMCSLGFVPIRGWSEVTDAAATQVYKDMQQMCFVDVPRAAMASIRTSMSAGSFSKASVHELHSTMLVGDRDRPKDGDAVKVVAEVNAFVEVEVPVYELEAALAKAKAPGGDMAAACEKARTLADAHGEELRDDEAGRAAIEAVAKACPGA